MLNLFTRKYKHKIGVNILKFIVIDGVYASKIQAINGGLSFTILSMITF
jgi:hypothetical protein